MSVIHEDRDDVRDVAVFDAVVNNGDRKGSHLAARRVGALWGFDHGVTLSADPKLRTVLWGWAGEPLRDVDVARLERLQELLDDPASTLRADLARLLPRDDVRALRPADDASCCGPGGTPVRAAAGRPSRGPPSELAPARLGSRRDLVALAVPARGTGHRRPAPVSRHGQR